ncbi:MAG: RNA-binding domain-containing protein [Tissierellaceae bacterium]
MEFKESKNKLNKDVFDTVCAFLNRNGGHLFLGVKDDGTITGIDEDAIDRIKKDFVTSLNNSNKINPTAYVSIEEIEINGQKILHSFIPESSQVHRCNGKIYDRNEDGDFNIAENTTLVSNMYIRKQGTYTENKIFPYAEFKDLKSELFTRVRKMAVNKNSSHPWQAMDDFELLKSASLYLKDPQTGKDGITLGGILIFGTRELISAALPHYRTDAILRKVNLDRYDDRDDIRVNLIESHDRLMSFVSKHLNDNFYLEGDMRISVRDKIFREVVSNILIHREYSNPFPAKLIIEKDRVYIENGNKARWSGVIDPTDFAPYPKNPILAKFFNDIGWADELGSGVRNAYKYSKIYSGLDPEFIEGDIFKVIIPLATQNISDQATTQATMQATTQADEDTKILLDFCTIPRSRNEMQEFMRLANREHFRKNILNPLIKGGLLKLTIPDKPTSPNQKYYSEKR